MILALCSGLSAVSAQDPGKRMTITVDAAGFTSVFAHDANLAKSSLLEDGANVLQIGADGCFAFAPSFRLGIGAGYRFYAGKMKVGAVDEGSYRQFRQQSVPVCLMAGMSPSQWRVAPFLKVKAGYNIPTRCHGDDAYLVYEGFTAEGDAGLRFKGRHVDYRLGLALMLDSIRNSSTGDHALVPFLGLRIGMTTLSF